MPSKACAPYDRHHARDRGSVELEPRPINSPGRHPAARQAQQRPGLGVLVPSGSARVFLDGFGPMPPWLGDLGLEVEVIIIKEELNTAIIAPV